MSSKFSKNKQVFIWLLTLCALVITMVLIGGVTRLTGSGLSIVEWKPLMGAIPPLTHEDWLEVFGKYQQSPQYLLVNKGMSLADFQWIFFWEYFHRLIGRMIGIVFFVPWVWFWFKKYFDSKWAMRFLVGFLLGGLQGLMGWIMVASGLVDKPHVSHYRLAAHLVLAFFILAYFWRMAWLYTHKDNENNFNVKDSNNKSSKNLTESKISVSLLKLNKSLSGVLILLVIQIIYGAFVAGLRAGFMHNTFPDMEGQFFPSGAWMYEPLWKNIFENPLLVQWIHRTLGWSLFLGSLALFLSFRESISQRMRKLLAGLLLIVSTQFFLGVFTLITQVRLSLAVTHQVTASLVLLLVLWTRWEVQREFRIQSEVQLQR